MNTKLKFLSCLLIAIGLILLPYLAFDIEGAPVQITGVQCCQIRFLESRYLYLIHHLLAAVPVFFFGILLNMYSFRYVFMKDYLWPIIVIAILFIIWDIGFTQIGIWSFDKSYFLGCTIFKLPLEEYGWFFVIPFCGLFVYHCCQQLYKIGDSWDSSLKIMVLILFLILYYMSIDKLYTAESLAFCISAVLFGIVWAIPGFGLFLCSFGILLVPMIFFNGMLTGLFTKEALVVYNSQEFSNFRILSFPIEDMAFGFGLLYGIICLEFFIKRRRTDTYKGTK